MGQLGAYDPPIALPAVASLVVTSHTPPPSSTTTPKPLNTPTPPGPTQTAQSIVTSTINSQGGILGPPTTRSKSAGGPTPVSASQTTASASTLVINSQTITANSQGAFVFSSQTISFGTLRNIIIAPQTVTSNGEVITIPGTTLIGPQTITSNGEIITIPGTTVSTIDTTSLPAPFTAAATRQGLEIPFSIILGVALVTSVLVVFL
jgi:hypothetical protein